MIPISAKEMYDYLAAVTPDYNATLAVTPQVSATEQGMKNQEVVESDDNSQVTITYSSSSIFYLTLTFDVKSESDAGTVLDFYHDSAKANGMARSFKYTNYTEPLASRHTYVVKFAEPLSRNVSLAYFYGFSIKLRVLGYIVDA